MFSRDDIRNATANEISKLDRANNEFLTSREINSNSSKSIYLKTLPAASFYFSNRMFIHFETVTHAHSQKFFFNIQLFA